ncbi:MAG: hypothetical protein EA384_03780 [Spirochaetaceae bacterium]|nr:MAG: hypothetical protein EA384_03780 [Spirochaetaceae bacterium]
MNKTFLLLGWLVLSAAAAAPLYATELFADFSIGNLGFSRDRDAGDKGLPDDTFPWAFNFGLRHPAFETVDFEMALRRHHVVGNTTELQLTHRSDFVELGAGPYLGVYNNQDKPFSLNPGVFAHLRFNLGDFGFTSLTARAPLSDDPRRVGDYRQRTQEYQFGVFVPNVVLSLYYGSFAFDERTDDDFISDLHRAYELRAHVFQKNVPYRIDLSFGYHDYQKEFVSTDGTQAFGALVAATRVTADLRNTVSIFFSFENALYTFGRADLTGRDGGDMFFFRSGAGITYTVRPPHQ